MGQYTVVVLGGVTLHATSITPTKNPSSVKQKLGRDVANINVLGRLYQDWALTISGVVVGTTAPNLSTNRAALEALDDADVHYFTDSIHNGTYFIDPGSLQFTDEGETSFSMFKYQMKLLQKLDND